jgi:hypothetical protein
MGRKAMSEEEKKRAEELRNTPEGLRSTLARLRERESKLLVDLAIRDHPHIEDHIVEILRLVKEVETTRPAAVLHEEAVSKLKTMIETSEPHFKECGMTVSQILSHIDFEGLGIF